MMTDKEDSDKGFITIPNLLSFFRLILAPVILYAYVYLQRYHLAIGLVILSAITDVVDGYIARKFNLVSDIGKILDPFADKVTQLVMFLCLITRHSLMKYLVIVFIVKESLQVLVVYTAVKKTQKVRSARWYGKASTVCLYGVCLILMFLPNISDFWAGLLMGICMAMLFTALTGYVVYSFKLIFGKTND